MATVRPIRETIPLEDARAADLEAAAPIERTERVALRAANGRVLARVGDFHSRRAAVRSRGDGRLRGDRRGHVRREPLRAEDAALRRDGLHRPGAARARRTRRVHRDRDRRADAGGRGRGRDGRGDREGGRIDVRVFTPVYPRQHVGRRAADIAAGQTVLAAGDLLNPSRIGALAAIGITRRRGLRASRASRSSRPATRSSSPDSRSRPGRSTTSTGSRSRRSSTSTAASPYRLSDRCRTRSTS